jgi:tetratricopeptide (TPR) repeat protein
MRFSKNVLGVFVAGMLLAPITLAQGTELQIEKGIEFAQGLASKWQFVDLAQNVLDDLENGSRLTSAQEENIALVRCEIYGTAARKERDGVKRIERFTSAIQAYGDFINSNELSEYKPAAQRSLVQLANSFATALEIKLADEVGEEADATREQIRDVLKKPLQSTGALIGELTTITNPTEQEKRDKYAMMLDRGRMLAAMGRASEDGTYFFSEAGSTLEDLAMEAGERTGWGLQAYLELAKTKAGEGDWEMAMVFFEYVANLVMPLDKSIWDDTKTRLSPADREQHWYYTELAIPGLLDAAQNYGDADLATSWSLNFFNRFKEEGFKLSKPRGYLALLASAKTLLNAGGFVGGSLTGGDLKWYSTEEEMKSAHSSKRSRRTAVDLALAMAQTANEDNKGSALQVRAQKVISEVIDMPGMEIGPEVLYEAAQGHFFDDNYPAAIDAYKRTLAALADQDQATRTEFGPKVMSYLGKSYYNQGRYLEATMAFQEGVTTWKGDPTFDKENAKAMYRAISIVKDAAAGDENVKNLWLQAELFVTETAGTEDAGEILFTQGMREYNDREFDMALAKFVEVPGSSDSYEKALVYMAVCQYNQKKLGDATQGLEDYLGPYLDDPTHATTSEVRLAKRSEARAMATFYLGLINYNAKEWSAVIELLSKFNTDFPGQELMAPNAIYMALRSELNVKNVPSARELHAILLESFASNKYTGRGASYIYKTVKAEYEASQPSEKELGDLGLLSTMADLMKTDNGLAALPEYGKLRNESGHWSDLGNWEEAERVLRLTVEAFTLSEELQATKAQDRSPAENALAAECETRRTSISKYVLPELGDALVRLAKLPDALDVLRPLVPEPTTPEGEPEPEFKPSASTVTNFCKASVGWVEGEKVSNIKEILGVGTKADVTLAAAWLQKLTNREEKFTPVWYQRKFDTIFAWRRLGEHENDKTAAAQRQIKTLKQDVGDDLKGIQEDLDKANLDGATLREHFKWLDKKLK